MSQVCDFCCIAQPVVTYACEDFKMEESSIESQRLYGKDLGSRGYWAACSQCAGFIDAGAYEALAKYVLSLNFHAKELGPERLRQATESLHRHFREFHRHRKPGPF